VAEAATTREQQRAGPAPVTSLDSRRRRFVSRTFTGVAAAAALVVGVLVVGDVGGSGDDDQSASDGGDSAVQDDAGGASEAERGPSPASGDLLRLRSDDFGPRAEALLSRVAATDDATPRNNSYYTADGGLPAGACTTRDLRAARISGSLDLPARLDGEPVTLVTSGPRQRSLVVAYDCRTGTPVERQRAIVDLTR
jgi:hypothetical protein